MSYKQDYAFGSASEERTQSKLEEFLQLKLIRRPRYSTFDYDDGSTTFVELKTRRIPRSKYATAILGANKVKQARENLDKTYWFCYAYEDGLYGIQYDKDLFDTFETKPYQRSFRADTHDTLQECCFVPTDKLVKIH